MPATLIQRASGLLPALERDLAPVRQYVAVRLVDPTSPDAVALGVPDPASWIDDRDAEPLVLLLVNGGTRRFDDASDAELLVGFADLVQDTVIDETSRPWPEVVVGDRLRVLDPAVVGGEAVWCVGGEPYRRIGELWRLESGAAGSPRSADER